MIDVFMSIFEFKELFVGISLSILYITYYLVEVVKKPILFCREGEFRQFLEKNVPLLNDHYWPTPWCVESHLQTVLGSILRTTLLSPVKYRREVVKLPDGGQVALDWVEHEGDSASAGDACDCVVVIVPGLTGSARAEYVRSLASGAAALGARCVVFTNRGLGGLALTSPRLYCALSHADLAAALRAVRAAAPTARLLAAGVSLGGLILGHYLAEAGDAALLSGALAVSAPLDVERAALEMERAPLNALLSYHMARNLRRAAAALRAWPDPAGPVDPARPADWPGVERARSVRQFDAAFTARHFGFASVGAYYRAATLRDKLGRVRVPLLCLCAGDDPFQPMAALPAREALASGVALAVTARGGHIGFLEGWWPASPPHTHYIARLATQYFGALLHEPLPSL